MVEGSVLNRLGAQWGMAGIMPRGQDGPHRRGPLAIVRRANYSGDGWALHARLFLV